MNIFTKIKFHKKLLFIIYQWINLLNYIDIIRFIENLNLQKETSSSN